MTPALIRAPISDEAIKDLKAGEEVLLSGTVFTARDVAHKRIVDLIKKGRGVPLPLKGAIIYYAGPTPARPGRAIGSCGPTTSSRMDPFTIPLLELGLAGMIGKGERGEEVRRAIKRHKAVYFLATGGIGAYLSTKVKKAKPILFRELGPEAVYKLEVADFPLIVGIDSRGNDIYRSIAKKGR
jgi:fumarate hydratase subunit beta